ncbi:MAG TPA: class I SAM-dependent methyltransferase [Candidatus Dormibacteraeota bacterium]
MNPLRRVRKRVSRSLLREELDRQHDLLEEDLGTLRQRLAAEWADRSGSLGSELAYVHAELERLEGVMLRPPWANLIGGPLQKLDAYTAAFLNYATGEYGYAAQAGLRLSPDVEIVHGDGAVSIAAVTPRVIDVPFAIRALAGLPAGAAILDAGGSGSALAHSLAGLGYQVTVVDPVPYPLPHPRLTASAARLEAWAPPDEAFDAIVALAVLEHVGREEFHEQDDADLEGMAVVRGAAKAGAPLVLSVPVGAPATAWSHRVYDRERVDALLAGWQVDEALLLTPAEHGWDAAPAPAGHLPPGRLLVRAHLA